MTEKIEHHIDFKSILYLVGVVVACLLVWKLGAIILLLVTALMLSSALRPVVDRLDKYMPRSLSIALVILGLLLPLVGAIVAVAPGLIRQAPEVVSNINQAYHSATFLPNSLKNVDLASSDAFSGQGLLRSTGKITGIITTILTLIFLTFYILIDSKSLMELFMVFVPDKDKRKAAKLLDIVGHASGQYIRGNLLISLICGLVTFAGLLIIKVPYAGPLAIFAGLTDLLPLIGSIVGAIPAVILAFTISPVTGLFTVLLFVVYQQVENAILAPNIYNKALNLSATISFVAVIIGASLFGMVGAFISLPIAASVPAIVTYVREKIED